MPILIFFIAHWYLSLFTQTFFHHRYAAHQAFSMSKFWEKVFYILSGVFQGSSYLSPRAYGALHRMHHAYADTEKDPHSPIFSKNIWDMMLKTKVIYHNIYYRRTELERPFTDKLPVWDACDRFFDAWPVRIFWGVFYTAFYVMFATHWAMYLLLPIHFIMGPFHGAIINWFAHKLGYVSWKVKDTSKNLLFFDFLMLGESYHNNHHRHPKRANFGTKWHEFDPIYPFILLFDAVGIIKLRKQTPLPVSHAYVAPLPQEQLADKF
ncbi:MAG: acyl-CoA desaturase [Bacteroidetes bacterium]|nr:acyl-CoA desaturase [Bacteroidota bacterium]